MAEAGRAKNGLNNSELWGGLVGLALGMFVIWSGYKLKIGIINDPGSGFVLFHTGILMCLFALSITIAAVTEGGPSVGSLWAGTRWTKPLVVIACLSLFAFLFEPLGFLLSSIPLLFVGMLLEGPLKDPMGLGWPQSRKAKEARNEQDRRTGRHRRRRCQARSARAARRRAPKLGRKCAA